MDDAGDQKRLYDLHARADARLRVDDVDGALTLLGEALALDPRDEVSRRMRETAERRRDQLAEPAAAPAGGPNSRSDEFTALMRRRRHREAVALAELILSAGPSLHDLRVFWDPWSWPEGLSRAERIERSGLREMERELGEGNPWLLYYRADLKGSDGGFDDYDRIAGLPAQRYGWMLMKAGRAALFSGRFEKAEEWLQRALEACSLDWRARCLLAETRLCLGRTKPAFDAMDAALAQAGPGEKGQVLAWSGELYLWIGEYRKALSLFEAACGLGARHAFAWKGAALLKLGKRREALRLLEEAMKREPLDLEGRVWLAEAKRELGRPAEALAELSRPELATPDGLSPMLVWGLVNRALAKAALGDAEGLRADFALIPADMLDFVMARSRTKSPEAVLKAALRLARGFRREEYGQAVWMRRA